VTEGSPALANPILLKAKAVPLHAMKAFVGRAAIAPTHSRTLHYMGVSGVTPRPRFSPGDRTPVPFVQEAGRASEPVWK
jgi:hypothetical protein